MEIDPASGQAVPFAYGFRSPDGIGFDSSGTLVVSDNQGDWLGACELKFVRQGGFYGHPASLVWRPGWNGGDPLKIPVSKLLEERIPPAIQFPYGTFVNSATQMLIIPKLPEWGPFGGQMVIGEMNAPRLLRVLPENIEGVWQGACIPFIDSPELQTGLHRLAFIGSTLWVGRTHLAWPGAEGISYVQPTAAPVFDPLHMRVTPHGFRFSFTAPLNPNVSNAALWVARRYTYLYHAAYGSPEVEKEDVHIGAVALSSDRREADLTLPGFKPNLIYQFDLSKLTSASGTPVLNPRIAYTLLRIPK